jgi:hypothetical protein
VGYVTAIKIQDAATFCRKAEEEVQNDPARRASIVSFGASIFAAAVGRQADDFGQLIPRLAQTIEAMAGTTEARRNAVRALFKVFGETRFVPGFVHPKFLRQAHPNDARTLAPIAREYFFQTERQIVKSLENELLVCDDVKASLFCAGGPSSNQISRLLLQYGYDAQGQLRRVPDPIFQLHYEYSEDPSRLDRTQIIDGQRHEVSTCTIRCSSSGMSISDESAAIDHLLIFSLPNVLDRVAYEQAERIIIAGGCHGVGTRALELVLANDMAVAALTSNSAPFEYWQAVVPVTRSEIQRGSTVPTEISVDEILVRPITFDFNDLERGFLAASANTARAVGKSQKSSIIQFSERPNTAIGNLEAMPHRFQREVMDRLPDSRELEMNHTLEEPAARSSPPKVSEEVDLLGQEIFDRLGSRLLAEHSGEYILINVASGQYEVGRTLSSARERYRKSQGTAPAWCTRIGASIFAEPS